MDTSLLIQDVSAIYLKLTNLNMTQTTKFFLPLPDAVPILKVLAFYLGERFDDLTHIAQERVNKNPYTEQLFSNFLPKLAMLISVLIEYNTEGA